VIPVLILEAARGSMVRIGMGKETIGSQGWTVIVITAWEGAIIPEAARVPAIRP
jgi:hypothetical protein